MDSKIKRIALTAAVIFGAGALFYGSEVASPPPAQAQRGCDYGDKTWYLGVQQPDGNKRFAELNAYGKGCSGRGERAKDRNGYMKTDIHANSYSVFRGYEWHIQSGREVSSNRWQSSWVADGWYRGCLTYKIPIMCTPTSTFRIYLTYSSDWLMRRSSGVRQFEYNIQCTNSLCSKTLRAYSTP